MESFLKLWDEKKKMSFESKTNIYRISVLFLLAVSMGVTACAKSISPRQSSDDVRVINDVSYYDGKSKDEFRHKLDIYLPREGKKWPTVVFIHGGAWVMGGKRLVSNVAYALAENGVACVSVNYRLTPRVQHPGHVKDVARAIAWTRKNLAKYGADTDALFISGHSAGSHLASLVSLDGKYLKKYRIDNRKLAGVIAISGVYEINHEVFEPVFTEDRKVWADASPINHIDKSSPPFLVLFAENDMDLHVPLINQAEDFYEELQRAGVDASIKEIRRTNHKTIISRIGNRHSATLSAMLDFIDDHR